MSKYDYYVTAVKYNSDKTHIAELKVHPIADEAKLSAGVVKTRPEVVELINSGKTFCTLTKKSDGNWAHGAQVKVMPVKTDYLKTTADETTKDNLENLPTF